MSSWRFDARIRKSVGLDFTGRKSHEKPFDRSFGLDINGSLDGIYGHSWTDGRKSATGGLFFIFITESERYFDFWSLDGGQYFCVLKWCIDCLEFFWWGAFGVIWGHTFLVRTLGLALSILKTFFRFFQLLSKPKFHGYFVNPSLSSTL